MRGRAFLALIAVVAWLAVAFQVYLTTRAAIEDGRTLISGLVQVFSYFTILTNTLVAIVSTVAANHGPHAALSKPGPMTATAVYITIVGLIYAIFLKAIWEPTGLQLVVDIVLHEAVPILFVVHWLFFVPKGTLRWSQPVGWLVYPLAYVIYSIIYGKIAGRYLYWFADVDELGYPRVFLNAGMILIAFLVVGLIAVAIDRVVGGRRSERRATS